MKRIISLEVENVKRLVAGEINPDGSLVVVAGKNGAGKTSVLDSIEYALGGKSRIPDEPLRRGASVGRAPARPGPRFSPLARMQPHVPKESNSRLHAME